MWPTDEFAEANSKMGCNIKQQTQRQRSSAKFALTITLMTSFILFGLISCVLERVQCVTQQQQTLGGELTNDNSQNTLTGFRNGLGGGVYSSIVDGVDGNNGFMGWARNTYANTNNKRARKMSAFMPMRGRKDGRDEPLVGSDPVEHYNENPMGDSNRGDSDSVHDWITASTLSPWNGDGSNRPEAGERSHQFVGTPVPLQFANQVAAHRLQQRLMMQSRPTSDSIVGADNDGGVVSSSAGDPMTSASATLSLAPGAFERSNLAPGSSAGVMQAKLRRAFHPMRGKKWASNDGMISLDQVAAEMALARSNGLDM